MGLVLLRVEPLWVKFRLTCSLELAWYVAVRDFVCFVWSFMVHCIVACYGCFVLLAGFGFLVGALRPWFVWWV